MAGVWFKQGVIVPPTMSDLNGGAAFSGTSNCSVLYEGNPQLISPNPDGKVFKMWFQGANNTYYAESNTSYAGSWTRKASAILPAGTAIPQIYKDAGTGTYYLYASPSPGGVAFWHTIAAYTSTDGVNFTLANATALSISGGGFDNGLVLYLKPFQKVGSTYSATYFAVNNAASSSGFGIATSTDLLHWTNGATQLIAGFGNGTLLSIGGTYYFWSSLEQNPPSSSPGDIGRASSANLATWTVPVVTLPRSQDNEGVNSSSGAMAGASLVEVNGKSYIFYTGTPNEPLGTGYQVMSAIANEPIASLISGNEGMANGFVQSKLTAFANAATYSATFNSANTAGNVLVAVSYNNEGTSNPTVTDTQGNTWTLVDAAKGFDGALQTVACFACIGCKAGANTVTWHTNASANVGDLMILEYTGFNAIDVHGITSGNSAAPASPTVTTTGINEFAVGYFGCLNDHGVLAGNYTFRANDINTGFAGDAIQSRPGSLNASATCTAGLWAAGILTLVGPVPVSGAFSYAFEA